ncbi:hypothetical protein NG895_00965 [Aeoliella sp. ICT_H6.2]|uniref:Uncharacterized protein n=1 Tax=Aeoliella straminimaris TaxID=2954799 RepID=A0A9X2FDZ1_9BACT|nr:hypothetical protein [Aeoliella straminimaris]MCO6042466.1 hypothetical protein [Aeoliella straminimaris]
MSESSPHFSLWSLLKWITMSAVCFATVGLTWRKYEASQRAYQLRWGPGLVENREHWPDETRRVLEAAEQAGQDDLKITAYRHSDGWGWAFFWKLNAGNDAKQRIIQHWNLVPLAPADPQNGDFWAYMPRDWLKTPGPSRQEMYAWPGIGDCSRYILLHDLDEDTLYFCDVFDF